MRQRETAYSNPDINIIKKKGARMGPNRGPGLASSRAISHHAHRIFPQNFPTARINPNHRVRAQASRETSHQDVQQLASIRTTHLGRRPARSRATRINLNHRVRAQASQEISHQCVKQLASTRTAHSERRPREKRRR